MSTGAGIALAALATACGSEATSPLVPVAVVGFCCPSISVGVGSGQAIPVSLRDANGTNIDPHGRTYSFAIDDATIARIDSIYAGTVGLAPVVRVQVTLLRAGQTTIRGKAEGVAGSMTLIAQ